MTAISIRDIWMEYGDQVVLERVSLEIAPRSFLALVGPSGCGKSTFLRLLLGEERPTRGHLLLEGTPLPVEPGPDRGIVFQRYSVFPHLTVLGNVLLGLELRAAPFLGRLFGPARRQAVEEAVAMLTAVGLDHALD
jgi:NitT/TauT family transport system ATP-binding protein